MPGLIGSSEERALGPASPLLSWNSFLVGATKLRSALSTKCVGVMRDKGTHQGKGGEKEFREGMVVLEEGGVSPLRR